MIVRVCSPYGTKRINIDERESVNNLFDKIKKEFTINDCQISRKPNGDELIHRSSKHIQNIGLKHGDMVYLHVDQPMRSSNESDVDGDFKHSNMVGESSQMKISVQEDEIDRILSKQDGQIYRPRNEQYCRHGLSGKCIHCVPLQPYDEQYLEHCDPPIQFISFHAYLRKLSGGQHKGKFTTLENINCKIKTGCKEHLPWPEGICTKCQPSAITLSVQKYRHVDNIMFENAELMNDFLDYWRKTGNQRIGILFGYYTTFDQAPLGIKAVVTAIYEPVQKSTSKSVELLNLNGDSFCVDKVNKPSDFLNSTVTEVAGWLGLVPVGWIFTDLVSEDPKAGTVKHYRGSIDTYFMTAQECITAAFLQNMFPNICNLSAEGHFGSKFVTVVVTGDASNTIHFEGYQVSNQCMALVRDDVVVPTCDAPELGYVRESTSTRYVPDVFCKQKDKYGNSVTSPGRPLPVEFLLVHMTAAFPKEEQFSVAQRKMGRNRFSIENRDPMGEIQNFGNFVKYMGQFPDRELMEAVCNVHVLWYLAGCKGLPMKEGVRGLCEALREAMVGRAGGGEGSSGRAKVVAAVAELRESGEWRTVQEMMRCDPEGAAMTAAAAVGPTKVDGNGVVKGLCEVDATPVTASSQATDGQREEARVWPCQHCTFHNEFSESSCQMCGLPR